jgi:hypothetical protein
MLHRWLVYWALTPLLGLPAFAQSVISAHSGLLHLADGSVFLDDQRVEQKTGKFDQMKNGSELRTQDGRAELLLTPGTFLRIGPNSAVRMVSNELDNTRVELLTGSAVLDQGPDTLADTSVTILYNLDQVHILKPGRYRFDSEPPQVKVEKGSAEVLADGKSVEAGAGYAVALEGKLTARKLLNNSGAGDDLDTWNSARNQSVTDNDLNAASASDLSGVIDGWQKDPDAVLQALGIAPYPQGMSSYIPPYSYGAGIYGGSPYGSLYSSGLYGSAFGFGPYGALGFGMPSALFLYYRTPLYSPYRYPSSTLGSLSHRPITGVGRFPIAGRPTYQAPAAVRLGPIQSGVGVGRVGVGMGAGHPVGGVHMGAGHR